MEENILLYETVILKWCKFNLKESGIKIKNLDKDLRDGTKLCYIAKAISNDKTTEFNKKPKHHSDEKENIETAKTILKKGGYNSDINADDFQKDEKGEEGINRVKVYEFFWKLMLKFKESNFQNIYDPKINHHKVENMPKYLEYQTDFETYISLKNIGSCWEIKHDEKPKFYHKDEKDEHSRFRFNSKESYCTVGCAMVRGEKENSAIFVRLGKDSKDEDKKCALKYADKLKKTLGKNNVVVVAEEGNETPEYYDYLDPMVVYEEPHLDLYKVVDPDRFVLKKTYANDILINDELVIGEKDIYVLSNPKEVILFSNSHNPLSTRYTVSEWRKNHEKSKHISFTLCHTLILPMRVYFNLVRIKEEEDVQRQKEEEENKQKSEEQKRLLKEQGQKREEEIKTLPFDEHIYIKRTLYSSLNEENENQKKIVTSLSEDLKKESLKLEESNKQLEKEKNHSAEEEKTRKKLELELQQVRNDVENKVKEIEDLNKKLDQLSEDLKNKSGSNEESSKQLEKERNRFTEEEKKRKQLEVELENLREEEKKKIVQIEDLQKKVENLTVDLKNRSGSNEETNKQLEKERNRFTEEEKKRKQLEIDHQNLREEDKKKIVQIEDLQKKVENLTVDLKNRSGSNEENSKLLESERNRFTEEEKKRKQLELELQKSREEEEKRKQEYAKLQQDYNKSNKEFSDEKNKYDLNVNNLQSNYKRAENERDLIKSQAQEALNKQKLEYEQYLLKLNTEIESHQKIISQLKEEKNNSGENEKLLQEKENTINSLRKNIGSLEESLKKKEIELDHGKKELSSLRETRIQIDDMGVNSNDSSVGFSYDAPKDRSCCYKVSIFILIIISLILLGVLIYFILKKK
eukprot:TRINITY_DN1073_c0_g1_i2.p1 TRINITY_DN1073_c0_g1~~TRINITY_DN1073_c0_g1_i2.p1  ORF type:complete len:874 (+),score=348.20 TRINITY_DN1073_c0_g1_i2:37-2622(+)